MTNSTLLLALLAALLAATTAACIEGADAPPAEPAPAPSITALSLSPDDDCGLVKVDADARDTAAARPDTAGLAPDQCDLLPTDGPCALACDPDQLVASYVPQGTCMIIPCTLSNGDTFNTGGCNL